MPNKGKDLELNEIERARLRQEDGFGLPADETVLADAGIDWNEDARMRGALNRALEAPDAPGIADSVMRRIGQPRAGVGDALRDSSAPSLSDSVMAAVGLSERPSALVAEGLRAEAGDIESLWPAIAPAVGAEVGFDIRSALREGVESEGQFSPQGWLAGKRRWAVGGVAVAFAAAAALLLAVGTDSMPAQQMTASTLAPILDAPVEIESLEVGAASLVQVLQFGQEAPTIIFVSDDIEEAE